MGKFSFRKRWQSFGYAFQGIVYMLKHEHNAWIHALATFVVVAAGIGFRLSKPEWMGILFAIGLVFIAEGFNTAIERLADSITSAENKAIKNAKDVAAGAVLIAAMLSAIIGLMIFIPHVIEIFT
jgi:diacylglycerol kinase (ATP)